MIRSSVFFDLEWECGNFPGDRLSRNRMISRFSRQVFGLGSKEGVR